jgi:hypothetical protein
MVTERGMGRMIWDDWTRGEADVPQLCQGGCAVLFTHTHTVGNYAAAPVQPLACIALLAGHLLPCKFVCPFRDVFRDGG